MHPGHVNRTRGGGLLINAAPTRARACRYAFFQSALGLSAIIFRFWQNEDNFLGGALSDYGDAIRAVGWCFFVLVLLLLVHISMYLLPGAQADPAAPCAVCEVRIHGQNHRAFSAQRRVCVCSVCAGGSHSYVQQCRRSASICQIEQHSPGPDGLSRAHCHAQGAAQTAHMTCMKHHERALSHMHFFCRAHANCTSVPNCAAAHVLVPCTCGHCCTGSVR